MADKKQFLMRQEPQAARTLRQHALLRRYSGQCVIMSTILSTKTIRV